MLPRNNGITFRASSITEINDTTLELNDASIVNGCQTTMSIVRNRTADCKVLVKIVQASDSWDIAKAANFQNQIDQLDLQLARYIRPQAIRTAASKHDIRFDGESQEASAFAVIDAIYQGQITEEEFRSLFLGLFSSSPRNTISVNYTEVRHDLIEQLLEKDSYTKDAVFQQMFSIHDITQKAAQKVQEKLDEEPDPDELASMFQRFWKADKPNYRAFLAILAACACTKNNIYAKKRNRPTYEDMADFLQKVQEIIERRPDSFIEYYRLAFAAVALEVLKEDQDRDQILQLMKTSIERTSFDNLFFIVQTLTTV